MSKLHRPRGVRAIAASVTVIAGLGGSALVGGLTATPAAAQPRAAALPLLQGHGHEGFQGPQGHQARQRPGPERVRPGGRGGEPALQSRPQGRSDRQVPDHEPDLALPGLADHGQAAVRHGQRQQPVRQGRARDRVADRAVGAVVEEPDRAAEPEAEHASRRGPLHLLPGQVRARQPAFRPTVAGHGPRRVLTRCVDDGHGGDAHRPLRSHREDPAHGSGLPDQRPEPELRLLQGVEDPGHHPRSSTRTSSVKGRSPSRRPRRSASRPRWARRPDLSPSSSHGVDRRAPWSPAGGGPGCGRPPQCPAGCSPWARCRSSTS